MTTQIDDITPISIIGGIGQILTLKGFGFGDHRNDSYVSFFQESGDYMNETQSQNLCYLDWTDNQISLEMPCAFSGEVLILVNGVKIKSKQTLLVSANLGCMTYNPRTYAPLTNQNGIGGYTWHMHSSIWHNIEAKNATEEVFEIFRNETGINIILSNHPLDGLIENRDKINLIAFDPNLKCPGHINKAFFHYTSVYSSFLHYTSMLITLSQNESWYFGTGPSSSRLSKFRYVLLHELGHAAGLAHVNHEGQTMFPTVTLRPSEKWSYRDGFTTEEKIAIRTFLDYSKNFEFRQDGILPMESISLEQ